MGYFHIVIPAPFWYGLIAKIKKTGGYKKWQHQDLEDMNQHIRYALLAKLPMKTDSTMENFVKNVARS